MVDSARLAHRFSGEGTHLQRYASHLRCTEDQFLVPSCPLGCHVREVGDVHVARFSIRSQNSPAQSPRSEFATRAPCPSRGSSRGPPGWPQAGAAARAAPAVARRLMCRASGSLTSYAKRYQGFVVCEPRHRRGFGPGRCAPRSLQGCRVAADPAPVAGAERPGGWKGIAYFRLHGAPRMYWSRDGAEYVATLAGALPDPSSVDPGCVR